MMFPIFSDVVAIATRLYRWTAAPPQDEPWQARDKPLLERPRLRRPPPDPGPSEAEVRAS